MLALTEAATRRRAVGLGGPIAVSDGANLASESFTITGPIDQRARAQRVEPMHRTYKVTGIDPGPTAFQLGNCLTMRKSRDVVNTPGMYGKTRGLAMGWMNSAGTSHNFIFFEELFASEVALDYVVSEPGQQGDAMEGAVLVVALLIAFPNARFGLGLPGGDSALGSSDHYRSLGTTPPLDLSEASGDRPFLTQLFNYLRSHSYWVDDDLVHMLALLTDLCHDRYRIRSAQVLSLSTSGNHQVDAGLFHAYQLIEALLERGDHEPLRDAVARWNGSYALQLNADEIGFIKNLRDISLHFKAGRAESHLRESRAALGFDQDRSREQKFRNGMQRLLREAARAYLSSRMDQAHALDVCKT